MSKKGFVKKKCIVVFCSKCSKQFSSSDEYYFDVFETKGEAKESLLDSGWSCKNNKPLCDTCN